MHTRIKARPALRSRGYRELLMHNMNMQFIRWRQDENPNANTFSADRYKYDNHDNAYYFSADHYYKKPKYIALKPKQNK